VSAVGGETDLVRPDAGECWVEVTAVMFLLAILGVVVDAREVPALDEWFTWRVTVGVER